MEWLLRVAEPPKVASMVWWALLGLPVCEHEYACMCINVCMCMHVGICFRVCERVHMFVDQCVHVHVSMCASM